MYPVFVAQVWKLCFCPLSRIRGDRYAGNSVEDRKGVVQVRAVVVIWIDSESNTALECLSVSMYI